MERNTFSVTYEIVTPQSAEHGEAEATGFELEAGTLREAWDIVRWGGASAIEANEYPMMAPRWVTYYGAETSYVDGAEKSYSVHFPANITPASARRVARLLGAR